MKQNLSILRFKPATPLQCATLQCCVQAACADNPILSCAYTAPPQATSGATFLSREGKPTCPRRAVQGTRAPSTPAATPSSPPSARRHKTTPSLTRSGKKYFEVISRWKQHQIDKSFTLEFFHSFTLLINSSAIYLANSFFLLFSTFPI